MCKAAENCSSNRLIVFDLFASGKESDLFLTTQDSQSQKVAGCFMSVSTTAMSQTFKITQFVFLLKLLFYVRSVKQNHDKFDIQRTVYRDIFL